MDNPVVIRAAEVSQSAGVATLRFNFRGVGASGGDHDGGKGECDDTRAALAELGRHVPPGAPFGLLGYSFGAWVVARVAAGEPDVDALIAPPLAMFDFPVAGKLPKATLLVAGTRDSYCPVDDLTRLAASLPGAGTAIIDGADHFFFGKMFPLGEAVERWARSWAPPARSG